MNLNSLDKLILRNIQWPNDYSERRVCLWDISKKYNVPITTVKNRWRTMMENGFLVGINFRPNIGIFGMKRGIINLKVGSTLDKASFEFLKRLDFLYYVYLVKNGSIIIDFLYPQTSEPVEFIKAEMGENFDIDEKSFVIADQEIGCTILKRDYVIMKLLMENPLYNIKELASISGINRNVVLKSIEKLSQGNAFNIEPIINKNAVENELFAIYYAKIDEKEKHGIVRNICMLLGEKYLLTKNNFKDRVLILAYFKEQEEIDLFKEKIKGIKVKEQEVLTEFRTLVMNSTIVNRLMEEAFKTSNLNLNQTTDETEIKISLSDKVLKS
ncbi:MAG: hypothetical protein ACYDAO_03090 [Thermoplasmataceae archaeon]